MQKRYYPAESPFIEKENPRMWDIGRLSADWIGAGQNVLCAAYKLEVETENSTVRHIHVTADSAYRLYADGAEVSFGPDKGDFRRYFFDSLELELPAGKHVLTAVVWFFPKRPESVIGLEHGFFFTCEEEPEWNSGRGPWKCLSLSDAWTFGQSYHWPLFAGYDIAQNAARLPTDFLSGANADWIDPVKGRSGCGESAFMFNILERRLVPTRIPEQFRAPIAGWKLVYAADGLTDDWMTPEKARPETELPALEAALRGGTFEAPAQSNLTMLLTLDNYYCLEPELRCSGAAGASVCVHCVEALSGKTGKDNRAEWRGREFQGTADTLLLSGKGTDVLLFPPHHYRAARYVRIDVKSGSESLKIQMFGLRESRYPLEMRGFFRCSDETLNAMVNPAVRTLQMCTHDTFMDCPQYEQLMYLGDTRLQMLLMYHLTDDRRLIEQALRLIVGSQFENGIFPSRYPSREFQNIPTFTLFFMGIVHDFMAYDRDGSLARILLPAAMRAVESFRQWRSPDGLLRMNHRWNFIDWVPDPKNWMAGIPPEGDFGVSGIINWLYIYAQMELSRAFHGYDAELENRYARLAHEGAERVIAAFYRPERGLFSDVTGGLPDMFSEHAQCLALLSGTLPEDLRTIVARNLFAEDGGLAQTTVYFSFYYMETCREFGRMDKFFERLDIWRDMLKKNLKTLLEHPEPSRSDCHAWSSHILWHFHASVLGIRPCGTVPGGAYRIQPQLGPLTEASGAIPVNGGLLQVFVRKSEKGTLNARIDAPEGVKILWEGNGEASITHQGTTFNQQEK